MSDADLVARVVRLEVAFEEYRAGHRREHELLEIALDKAALTMNGRLENMNELRAQLDKQAGMFVTRKEIEPLQSARDKLLGVLAAVALLSGLLGGIIGAFLQGVP